MQILFELQQFSHQYLISVHRSNPGYHFAICLGSLVSLSWDSFSFIHFSYLLWSWHFSRVINSEVFYGKSYIFPPCFLMIRLGVWLWEWRPWKMYYSHHILQEITDINMTLLIIVNLTKVVFACTLHCEEVIYFSVLCSLDMSH